MEDNIPEMCKNCKYREMAENRKTPDLGEMIKLAMMVSKMFGQGTVARQPAPAPAPSPVSASEASIQSVKTQDVTDYDSLIQDKRIKIIKASLPFLHPDLQKFMHLASKMFEINNILSSQLYASRVSVVQTTSDPQELSLGMLRAITPHLDAGEKHQVEAACKALEMIGIMRSVEKLRGGKKKPDDEKEEGTASEEPPELINIST